MFTLQNYYIILCIFGKIVIEYCVSHVAKACDLVSGMQEESAV